MPHENPQTTLAERYRKVENHLAGNRIDDALSELRIIDALEKVAEHKIKNRSRLSALAVVCAAMVIVSLGVTLRLPKTQIDLVIKASGMELVSASRQSPVLANTAIEGSGISIYDASYFSNMPSDLYGKFKEFARPPAAGDISVEARSVVLKEFSLKPSESEPTIIIDLRQSNVDVRVKNAKLSGALIIREPRRVVAAPGERTSALFEDNAPFQRYERYFNSGDSSNGGVPRSVRLFDVRAFGTDVVRLRSADFSREEPPGSGKAQSTIVEGVLRILETGEEKPLRRGEYLFLECSDCSRTHIGYDHGHMILTLRGAVTRLSGGYQQELKNYVPTLLEYLYHNSKVAMLWAATLFVLGLLWKARNYVRKQS